MFEIISTKFVVITQTPHIENYMYIKKKSIQTIRLQVHYNIFYTYFLSLFILAAFCSKRFRYFRLFIF